MCPVCRVPLVVFEFEGVEVDHCLTCLGTWLDGGELESIAELAGVPAGRLTDALLEGGGAKHGNRRCCRCPEKLRIVNAGGVELDHCVHGHGLWFDRGEMHKALSTFEEGEGGAVARFFATVFKSEIVSEAKGG